MTKKIPHIHTSLLKPSTTSKNIISPKVSFRNSTILPSLVGKTFEVHNGKSYIRLTVTEEMIGHKLGEFVPTKLSPQYKKVKQNKNRSV
mmetsp:Transcript_16055/g.16247  ORF Transcript_16055/g.16247 Transcript_16055/m.16247 type:complete len:89 (-) Transcript_16055:534-800(-)